MIVIYIVLKFISENKYFGITEKQNKFASKNKCVKKQPSTKLTILSNIRAYIISKYLYKSISQQDQINSWLQPVSMQPLITTVVLFPNF